jgi:hypothetical protein
MRWFMLLAFTTLMLTPAEAEMYKGNETPAYDVEKTDGAFEIRTYPAHVVAEVTVEGNRDAAINAGFRVLAGYIFGGNQSRAKVAMTTPVTQATSEKIAMTTPVTQTGSNQRWMVQFMMPSTYTLQTLPKPDETRIRLTTTAPVRLAVLRFSGVPTTASLVSRSAELGSWAASKGLKITGAPRYMYYDAPFTLPWNRRNEVAFVLD